MAFDHSGQKSVFAFLMLLLMAGVVQGDFIVKPNKAGSTIYRHGTVYEQVTVTIEPGHFLKLKFEISSEPPNQSFLSRFEPPFFTVQPENESLNHGTGGPVGVTFKGSAPNSSVLSPYLLVYQEGGIWRYYLQSPPGSGSGWSGGDFYLTLNAPDQIEVPNDARTAPDFSETYQLGIYLHVNSFGATVEEHSTLIIDKFWVHLAGGEGEGGEDPDGDGDGDGDGKPPNKDPGDNPDDEPDDDEDPPDPTDPVETPETGIQCIDELMQIFKSKFPTFSDSLTSGNDFWKVQWELDIAGQHQTIYWSTKPDPSWGPGTALEKLRKWVRNFGILLMVGFALRQIVVTLRQW